jgi:hypothetical protein
MCNAKTNGKPEKIATEKIANSKEKKEVTAKLFLSADKNKTQRDATVNTAGKYVTQAVKLLQTDGYDNCYVIVRAYKYPISKNKNKKEG